MIIRVLNDNEKNRIRELYEEVFEDSQYFVDYYFNSYVKNTINFVCEVNERIVGMATIHPKKLMISENEVKVGYVYGVATKLSYRGQGIMRRLLEKIEEYAFENQFGYLYLIPANPKIYEGLGYELMRNACEMEFVKDNIEIENVMVEKIDAGSLEKCVEFIDKNYKNKVSIRYDEDYLKEILSRLSINNSGIYCIFDDICDKILGLAFIEHDEKYYLNHLICTKDNEKICVSQVMRKINIDKLYYRLHDIMFKEINGKIEDIKSYSICINDEV